MKGFARKNQFNFIKTYFKNKFFEDFKYVMKNNGNAYTLLFFKYLNPSFVSNDSVILN